MSSESESTLPEPAFTPPFTPSFTPPQAEPTGSAEPIESVPSAAPIPAKPQSGTLKTLLTSFALILLGVFIGVLASSFVPAPSPISPPTPTPEVPPSNLQSLTSPIYNFSVQVPDNWTRVETSSNFPYLFQFRASDESTFEVLVRDLPTGQTLEQYLSEQDEISQTAFEGQPSKKIISSQPITINGVEGVEREEEFLAAGLTGRVIYIVSTTNIYSLSFIPGPANNVLESEVYKSKQTIIDGFFLTTPEASAGYTCPPGEWVDCMPGPGPQNPQCVPAFLDWAKANCPGFQGAAL